MTATRSLLCFAAGVTLVGCGPQESDMKTARLDAQGQSLSAAARPKSEGRVTTNYDLCRSDEAKIFLCKSGNNTIAVCGTPHPDRDGTARFAFGEPNDADGQVSIDSAEGARFSWARTGYSGGGELQIRIAYGNVERTVYSRIMRTAFGEDGRHDPQDEAGFIERRRGQIVAHHKCDDAWDAVRYTANADDFMPQSQR